MDAMRCAYPLDEYHHQAAATSEKVLARRRLAGTRWVLEHVVHLCERHTWRQVHEALGHVPVEARVRIAPDSPDSPSARAD